MAITYQNYIVTLQIADGTADEKTLLKAEAVEALLNVCPNSASPDTKIIQVEEDNL